MNKYPATSKHTPLPWKFDNTSGCKAIKGGKFYQHKQSQYRHLADTSGIGTLRETPDADAEDRANATLMANAPYLWHMTRLLASYGCADEANCTAASTCGPCSATAMLTRIEKQARAKCRG